jgi:twinkle protein
MDLAKVRDSIIAALSAEQIESKIASDLNLINKNNRYLCHMHSEKHPSMSFNKTDKYFKCFSCKGTYNIIDHYMAYHNLSFFESLKQIITDFGLHGIELEIEKPVRKVRAKPIKHESLEQKVTEYLSLRKITEKVLAYAGVKADKGNIVFEYRDCNGDHVSNKYRPARKLSKDDLKMWFQKDTNCNTLYNMQKVDLGQPVVICEGEIDCLSLIQSSIKNAVSVPTGAASEEWIDSCWEWLSEIQEVVLWFDNDKAGREGVRKIATRLPCKVVKTVHSTLGKDINEILYKHGERAVVEEFLKAKEVDIDGIVKMSQIEEFNVYESEKVRTGINLLDKYIWGFVAGTLNIITGYNGSGKSTLINQMCIAESIAQGYKCFAFSGELIASNFKYWLYNTIANEQDLIKCTSKEGKEYYKISEMAKKNITEWIDNKLYLYDKIDYSADSILEMMELLAKRKGVRVFILDNLMKIELENSFKNEYLAQKKFVDRLKNFAVRYNAVIHLIAHPKKPSMNGAKINKFDISGTGDITNLADYVIAIHRTTKEERDNYDAEKLKDKGATPIDPRDASIMLFKDRPTGSPEKTTCLYFSPERKRFYELEKQLSKNYGYLSTGAQIDLTDEDLPF